MVLYEEIPGCRRGSVGETGAESIALGVGAEGRSASSGSGVVLTGRCAGGGQLDV